jgi:hypothetical protein
MGGMTEAQYIILYDSGSEVIKLKHVSEKEEE